MILHPLDSQDLVHVCQILLHLLRIDLALLHRQAGIRRANEDLELCGLWGSGLRDLDARCAIPYHADLLALDVYAIAGPERAVAHVAFEGVKTLP